MTTEGALSGEGLYLLLAWLSPSFPIGAYTYSHGLEWAVEEGTVVDAATLEGWLSGVLCHGAGWSDAVLIAHGISAAARGDEAECRDLLDLSLALQPTSERRLEATAQGGAFLHAITAAWAPDETVPAARLFLRLARDVPRGGWTLPLALALAAAAWNLPASAVLPAYLHGLSANLVSAAARAVPLGQTDGQRVLNALRPLVLDLAGTACTAPLAEIGGCGFLADIASMRHETQYTRLFRS